MSIPTSAVTAIYARKSRQAAQAFGSCEAQEAICRDLAAAFSWEIREVFADDGGSSETMDRPALAKLIEQIELGNVRRVIVDRADRLSRRLAVTARLIELLESNQVELVVVTDPNFGRSAGDRLASNVLAAASEFQMAMTRERMADMRASLKARGKRVAGPVPYGYRADPQSKQLIPHAEESVVVRDIFQLASDGARPSEIASLANLKRWPGSQGAIGKWSSGRIRDLLNNPIYMGEIRNGDSTLPGEHQGIVAKATFEAVQRHMESRRTQATPTRSSSTFRSLTGIVICGTCNRPMSTSMSQRTLGTNASVRYRYYRCRSESGGRPPCPGVSIQAGDLEQAIRRALADASEVPREFRMQFAKLNEREQLRTIRDVVMQAIYHPDRQSVQIEFREGAFNRPEAGQDHDP